METLPRLIGRKTVGLEAKYEAGEVIQENLQDSGAGKVAAVTEVRSSHHVLWVVHLLSQLWNGDSAEGVCTTASQRSESDHEEVETREGNHVHSEFPKVRVELTGEPQARGHTGHDGGDEMVEVAIRRLREFESPHADII